MEMWVPQEESHDEELLRCLADQPCHTAPHMKSKHKWREMLRILGTGALRLFRQDVFLSMRERVQESNDGTRETGALDFFLYRHCTHDCHPTTTSTAVNSYRDGATSLELIS